MEAKQTSEPSTPACDTLESPAAFVDQDGVLRRSSTVTRGMLLEGASVGKVEYLRQPSLSSLANSNAVDTSFILLEDTDPMKELENTTDPMAALMAGSVESKRRRSQLVYEIKQVKHALLVSNNHKLQERTQQWYDASEEDPDAETTKEHTSKCPSPRAKAFVDEEGNVRRKSPWDPASPDKDKASVPPPPPPSAPIVRPSLVLEFLQTIIDD